MNLPTELLRSFVAIVDAGSMLRAVDKVFVTQSALSLQIKRLEETVQAALFYREGRRLTLTPAGQALLVYAKEILAANDRAVAALSGDSLAGPARVGLVQDFAETMLSGVLSNFSRLNPDTELNIRVGGTLELLDHLARDRLDIVVGMGAADDAAAVRLAETVWVGDQSLAEMEVLPLAVMETPCRFRDAAIAALEAAGRPYRIALETPSISVLRAAIETDLAIGCRTGIFSSRRIDFAEAALPSLPSVAYVHHLRKGAHPTLGRLGDLLKTAIAEL